MRLSIFLFLIYFFLILIFPVRSYWDVKKISLFDKPVLYSTHFFLKEKVQLENCFDKNIETSCYEFFIEPKNQSLETELYIKPVETAFVVELSPTHHMGYYPPKSNPIDEFWIYLRREDFKYNVPKKILLVFYEQKLYQINHEYRFPDQPKKVYEFPIHIENQTGWQRFKLPERVIPPSKGFSENIYQRWVKIIVKEIYKNNQLNKISISEMFFKDQFFYSEHEN